MAIGGTQEAGGRRRDRGVALLFAIWMIMLVSLLALGAARESRDLVREAARETANARARALAEAGVARMALALAAEARGVPVPAGAGESGAWRADAPPLGAEARPLRLDGGAYLWRRGAAEITLTAAAERGRVDLNKAEPATLAALFRALGLRAALVEEIERARAPNRRRAAWRLGERPFETVSDLLRLTSLTPAELDRAAPYLTTEGGTLEPDPRFMSEALLALTPMDAARRADLISERRRGAAWRPQEAEVVRVTAEARAPDGGVGRAEALVAIAPRESAPILRIAPAPR